MLEIPPAYGANAGNAGSAALDRQVVTEFIVRMSELRAAGDIEGMLTHVADDVVCHASPTWSHSLFTVTLRGKAALRQGFRERYVQYEFLPSEFHRVLIDGDRAIVHRTTELRARGGGETIRFDLIDLLRFRDGLISEFTEFPDGFMREGISYFPR